MSMPGSSISASGALRFLGGVHVLFLTFSISRALMLIRVMMRVCTPSASRIRCTLSRVRERLRFLLIGSARFPLRELIRRWWRVYGLIFVSLQRVRAIPS
nr:MAG TPA: hypothetical protein [Caudoviricetes sp.]